MSNYIKRRYDDIKSLQKPKYVTAIYGARRCGKTTTVDNYLSSITDKRILRVTGDDLITRNVLSSELRDDILDWASGYDIVFIDEAQRIPKIGWGLKILIDARPDLEIIVTGSASFDLASQIGAPLTGRLVALNMFPIAVEEMATELNKFELQRSLGDFLVYGMYPEVRTATSSADKQAVLNQIVSAYLFKDIFEIENVKNTKLLLDLLTLVAYQIGNEVSKTELAGALGINVRTVERYLDLFEKNYILYNLRGFSRNLRSEVTRTSKYYFYDNGIRNAIIGDFNDISVRGDRGELFENFMCLERTKYRTYHGIQARDYFWRTWDKNEIDLVEDRGGKLYAYEFKYSDSKAAKAKAPSLWAKEYPQAKFEAVSASKYFDFVSDSSPGTVTKNA